MFYRILRYFIYEYRSGASANFSFIGEGFVLMSQLCGYISAAFIKKFTQNQNAVLLVDTNSF